MTEIFISTFVDSVVLGGIFYFLSNRSSKEQEDNLKNEMVKIETEIVKARDDVISQVKESAKNGNS